MGTFFGHQVRERVGVVILAAEGAATIPHRIEAARRARGAPEALPIAWTGDVPNLAEPKNLDEMIARVGAVGARFRDEYGVRLGAVIIDTVAAAFHLKDENDNAEAARVINHLRRMGDALGCLMMPIHHFGKSADTGLRGASAFRAGADVVISVLADRNEQTGEVTRRRIAIAKSRTRDEGPIGDFALRFQALGTDDFGEEFGACYVEPLGSAKGASPAKPRRLPASATIALGALNKAIEEAGEAPPTSHHIPHGVRAVTVDVWRRYAVQMGISESGDSATYKAFTRAKSALVADKRIGLWEPWAWLA